MCKTHTFGQKLIKLRPIAVLQVWEGRIHPPVRRRTSRWTAGGRATSTRRRGATCHYLFGARAQRERNKTPMKNNSHLSCKLNCVWRNAMLWFQLIVKKLNKFSEIQQKKTRICVRIFGCWFIGMSSRWRLYFQSFHSTTEEEMAPLGGWAGIFNKPLLWSIKRTWWKTW